MPDTCLHKDIQIKKYILYSSVQGYGTRSDMSPGITALVVIIIIPMFFARVEGHGTLQKENITTALLMCDSYNGLIGLDYYYELSRLMKERSISDVWVYKNFTDVIGRWKFLYNNTLLDDPKNYFSTQRMPVGCAIADIGEQEFVPKNCMKCGFHALCQNCSRSKTGTECNGNGQIFHSDKPTRNWFHARQFCINRGGDLSFLKIKNDIPDIQRFRDKSFWTGTHSLKDQVILKWEILANISLTGEEDVPKLITGDACLVAKQEKTVTWSVVSCSEKHHFLCRAVSISVGGISSTSLINTILITQIGYLAIGLNIHG